MPQRDQLSRLLALPHPQDPQILQETLFAWQQHQQQQPAAWNRPER